jgi:hypothetical protein
MFDFMEMARDAGNIDCIGDHVDIKAIIFGSASVCRAALAMAEVPKFVKRVEIRITFHVGGSIVPAHVIRDSTIKAPRVPFIITCHDDVGNVGVIPFGVGVRSNL